MRSLIFFALVGLAASAAIVDDNKPRMVCYFGSWAVYRPDAGRFDIADIDANLCTHLIYTFVGLSGDDVKVLDSWQDLPNDWGKDGFGRFNALREKNPHLKTLVAIGGWNEGSTKYSEMASNPAARKRFAQNAVKFVKKHNFDGFDLDWEYPCQRGGAETDLDNFSALTKEMREQFDAAGLILSAAVASAEFSAAKSYNIAEISKNLHFINVMTYDLHGSWEPKTGINAALYPSSSETGKDLQLNVQSAIEYWLSQGADPKKINMGVASYGRSFTLAHPDENGVGAPIRGPGTAGPYTREGGMLGYNEICEMQNKEKWTVIYHEEHRTPYAYRDTQWVGYENVESIKEKAEYIKKMNLGGAMIWSIETDDFKGICGEKYPLIKTLIRVLRGENQGNVQPPQTPKPTQKPTETPTEDPTEEPTESPTENPTENPTTQESNQEPNQTTKPDQPDNTESEDGECTQAGDMPHESDCSKFIKCVDAPAGKFKRVIMTCAPGTCFKPETGICDWIKICHCHNDERLIWIEGTNNKR